ncbi:FAD/NAD(P)-binding domain-containing protein [Hypoxylon trugodes]|uniref:FAD/NAD(P)-binding domain-containing protein n=1 Tax=Hypoxylon trugodes TaxID=326681 RepID=UPI0021991E45|nr:FAD/NAD(P)-binding domain-containing protein [Hypoxylon trugodes]KAI1387709.1 FAD/NAD(P)-binding domain-containing protein [Hypoxylon trugodes]
MTLEYEIIIIGGGPAGLSAASSIVRQGHKTILFDSGVYRNSPSKHLHAVPGWDYRDPEDFRGAARKDLARYGTVEVENLEIQRLRQRDDGLFEATSSDGERTWVGQKVILATGVEDVLLDIPGYAECWVSGIFHCLYCHGWEEKGVASAGILAEGDIGRTVPALHFARQALRMSAHVTLYTNGNETLTKNLTDALAIAPAPMKVDSRKIIGFTKAPERSRVIVRFEDGTSTTEGFLAHKPRTRLRGTLAQQLGLEMTVMKTIKVSQPFNQTSLAGVFAAGDCAAPMQTITAALHSGTCTGGGAPLQIQAETFKQRAIF